MKTEAGEPYKVMVRTKWNWKQLVKTGRYYQINGTKKVLYWEGTEWRMPVKDNRGSYGGWTYPLEKQPANVKSVKEVSPNVIGCL